LPDGAGVLKEFMVILKSLSVNNTDDMSTFCDTFTDYLVRPMNVNLYDYIYIRTSLNTNFWDYTGKKSDVLDIVPVQTGMN
jgi:hypothetical protein